VINLVPVALDPWPWVNGGHDVDGEGDEGDDKTDDGDGDEQALPVVIRRAGGHQLLKERIKKELTISFLPSADYKVESLGITF
jgi:hypothetical protein